MSALPRQRVRAFANSPAGRWAATLTAFAILRVVAAVHAPVSYPDTPSYRALDFLGGQPRLWTVPLLWTVLGSDAIREAAQVLIGIGAWSALAWSLAKSLTGKWVRQAAAALVLMLGLLPQVAGWDGTLLSESLSTSLLVLLIALLLRVTQARSTRLLVAAVLVATLWTFARHVNVLLYVTMLPCVVAFTFRRLPLRTAAWVVTGLVAIGAWGVFCDSQPAGGTVWKRNALLIVMDKVARHPDAFRFFAARGLPTSDLLVELHRPFPSAEAHLWADRRLMSWIGRDYKPTYVAYLASQWPRPITDAFANAPNYISSPLPLGKARTVLPRPLDAALWGSSPQFVLIWLALAGLLAVVSTASGAEIRGLPVIALLLLAAAGGCIVIWNTTDPDMVLARQFLPVAITLRLGVLLTVACSVDALLERLRQRSRERIWLGTTRGGLPGPGELHAPLAVHVERRGEPQSGSATAAL